MPAIIRNRAVARTVINPIPGFTNLTFDKGIDGGAPAGSAILAPAASTLVQVMSNFYQGQPLLLFKFDTPLPNAPSQYWFISEQIVPVSTTIGDNFQQGATVATFAPSGSGIEIGWGDPNSSDLRYAPIEAHYGTTQTGWGYNFYKFFGVGGGTPQTGGTAPTGPAGPTGLTRPGGTDVNAPAADTGDPTPVFEQYEQILRMPRTAPKDVIGGGPLAGFRWWKQSFTGKWPTSGLPAVQADATAAAAAVSAGASSLQGATGGGQGSGTPTYGLISNQDVQTIAAQHNWNDPADISAWWSVIKSESDGTLTDTNPSSGAYGIAQFINGPSEYATYGGDSTTIMGQLTAMANYIAQRYGNPIKAWAFHRANNWY